MHESLGHYTVGPLRFERKLDAMARATSTGEEMKWYFHDELYNAADWMKNPSLSLKEIYKQRAQQIRDDYDYVLVMVSGGADSTNVVLSFLENGIHIDEVVAGAPLSGLKSWNWSDKDYRPENMVSETKYAQIPFLDEIKTKWPNVRVTINDYFEEMARYETDEWIQNASVWINSTCARHSLDSLKHIKDLAEQGKRIAKVYGIDKPILCRGTKGGIYATIPDGTVQVAAHKSTREGHSSIEPVLFYYAPEMTQVMVKMSHVLAKFIYMPENWLARKTMWDLRTPKSYQDSFTRFSVHHRYVAKSVYPALDGRDTFQTTKSLTGLQHLGSDAWVKQLHAGTRMDQMMDSDASLMIKHIGPRFYDRELQKFLPLYKWWQIGYEEDFAPEGYVDIDVSSAHEVLNIPGVR